MGCFSVQLSTCDIYNQNRKVFSRKVGSYTLCPEEVNRTLSKCSTTTFFWKYMLQEAIKHFTYLRRFLEFPVQSLNEEKVNAVDKWTTLRNKHICSVNQTHSPAKCVFRNINKVNMSEVNFNGTSALVVSSKKNRTR